MKYPIGIQSFSELRTLGCVYVDKTAIIHRLLDNYKYVFLGRPRRFGKSLLVSTIQAYFEARKDLFEGLAIENLTNEWIKHPVFHFDLNTGDYQDNGKREVLKVLNYQLKQYEDIYGGIDDTVSNRFLNLIRRAKDATGQNVVVLIDEYDKPILSTLGSKEEDEIRNTLKSFYGCLKSSDQYIKFVMITGVSKFGKLSVFSDLNNIKDISLNENYAALCGITQSEIMDYFHDPLEEFASALNVAEAQMLELLRQKYDGYRFSDRNLKVFNPFSLLNAFSDRKLKDYWFESGTPTFLVRLLKRHDYNLLDIEYKEIDENSLYIVDDITPIPILYQSGYLTIKDYIEEAGICILGYPNREVENGFLKFLLPYYSHMRSEDTTIELFRLINEIKNGDINAFMTRIMSIFYSIPYSNDNSAKVQEDQFRNLMYLVFRLIGMNITVECPMSKGRTDAVVVTHDHVYVMEFKIDSTPEKALEQIYEKRYAEQYRAGSRKVVLLGINYSTQERAITGWVEEKL